MPDLIELKQIQPFMNPIIAIVMPLGIGMLALWLNHQKKTRMLELHHQERLLALERGIELPPKSSTLGPRHAPVPPSDDLRRGLVGLLAGSALGAALWTGGGISSGIWGLVPMSVGAAYLLWYATDVHRRINTGAHHRENRHGFSGAVDRRAPALAQQEENC